MTSSRPDVPLTDVAPGFKALRLAVPPRIKTLLAVAAIVLAALAVYRPILVNGGEAALYPKSTEGMTMQQRNGR